MIGKVEAYFYHNCEYNRFKNPDLKTSIFLDVIDSYFPGLKAFIKEAPEFSLRIVGPFKGRKTVGFRLASAIPEIFRALMLSLNAIYRKEVHMHGVMIKLIALYTKNRPHVRLYPQTDCTYLPKVRYIKLHTLTPIISRVPIIKLLENAYEEYKFLFSENLNFEIPMLTSFKFKHVEESLKGYFVLHIEKPEFLKVYRFIEIAGLGTRRLEGYGDISVEYIENQ